MLTYINIIVMINIILSCASNSSQIRIGNMKNNIIKLIYIGVKTAKYCRNMPIYHNLADLIALQEKF